MDFDVRAGDEVFITMKNPSLVDGGDLIGSVTDVTESTISLAGETFLLAELASIQRV